MPSISKVEAREILDSRGNPTIETKVILDNGKTGIASIPSGASTGHYEAVELRDGDMNRYFGMGVQKAVINVNELIGPKIIGMDPAQQTEIDELLIKLDGTSNKSRLGANAILSISQGICEAAAAGMDLPNYKYVSQLAKLNGINVENMVIPISTFNIINGGKHGAGNLEFQEFHIIPVSDKEYKNRLETAEEIYQAVEKVLIRHGAIHSVGDEGGFAPNLFTNLDALEVIVQGIKEAGYELDRDVYLGLDIAATHFFKNGRYSIRDRTQPMDTSELIEFYQTLFEQYPLRLIEDPIYEDDWESWSKLFSVVSDRMLVVGDDLLCTNPERLKKAIAKKACNSILIKPNQIGTLTETMRVIKIARDAGWKVTVSHRSGETNDDFIADFAVGVGADYTKFGAPSRGERMAKYNRLLEIESELPKTIIKQ